MRLPPGSRSSRVLWNAPEVIGFAAMGLLVTVAILGLQIAERRGVFEPDTVTIFYRLFLFQDYGLALAYLAVLLLALVPHVQQAATRFVVALSGRTGTLAFMTFAALGAASYLVYLAEPLAMDEYGPFMQSEIFASGALTGSIPPYLADWIVFPGFQDYFIRIDRDSGSMASVYWPGFALMLTPFKAIGLPWLCNPLLAALALLAIHRIVRVMGGAHLIASVAVLFTLASPAFVVNAMSFYSMTAHLLLNAVFVLLLAAPTPARAALAGLVGGLALTLHNPLPHAFFAFPWLAWLAIRSDRWSVLPALGAGYLPGVVGLGFGWAWVLRPAAPSGADTAAADAGASLVASAVNSLNAVLQWPTDDLLDARMIGLAKLWLWAAPALLLLAVLGGWRHRRDVRVRLLIASVLCTFVGYLFVPFEQGHGWGFRYMHSAWFVLPVLGALCFVQPQTVAVAGATRQPLLGYATGLAFVGLLLLVPLTAWQVNSFIRRHQAQLPVADSGTPRVVIVNPYGSYYAQDLVQNDPFLRDPVIRMVTRGRKADREMIEKYFPDLVLLESGYRGWVWGYPNGSASAAGSAVAGLPGDDQSKQE